MITRRTIEQAVRFSGVGLHGGRTARVTVAPAQPGSGIVFRRTDSDAPAAASAQAASAQTVPARYDRVVEAPLSTSLGDGRGRAAGTVEHLMAALYGCGVTDARIDLDGPEVPVLDGSALPFVRAFLEAGLRDLGVPLRAIRILRPVTARLGDRLARLAPAPRFEMEFAIRFADPAIGAQSCALALAGGALVAELADARTFGLLAEVDTLRRAGLGLGGSLDSVVVVDRGRVLNPEGLRRADEFVRHKMLDAAGDLALAGAPIVGRYTGVKAGHALTNRLLATLFATPGAWCWCAADPAEVPGGPVTLPPARPEREPVAV